MKVCRVRMNEGVQVRMNEGVQVSSRGGGGDQVVRA